MTTNKPLTIIVLLAFLLSNAGFKKESTEYWGFCTARKNKIVYISPVITYPIEDAQLGFPNTKIIRKWRLVLKEELGNEYSEDFKLNMEYRYCAGSSYHSRLEAEEGRDCFIDKAKKEGLTIKRLSLVYY